MNNKGFTLVELLISISIASVLIITITSFMSISARTYADLTRTVDLKYESQIVMAQIQDRFIDCNGGIAYENDTIYVVNKNSDSTKSIYVYKLDADTNELLFGTTTSDENDDLVSFASSSNVSSLMSASVDILNIIAESDEITSLELITGYVNRDQRYDATQNIFLRNSPFFNTSLTELLKMIDNT